MMKAMKDDKVIEIIQDHTLMCHFLMELTRYINGETGKPNMIPAFNDTVITDQFAIIAENLQNLKPKKFAYEKERYGK